MLFAFLRVDPMHETKGGAKRVKRASRYSSYKLKTMTFAQPPSRRIRRFSSGEQQ
jgi:hypothetical protein